MNPETDDRMVLISQYYPEVIYGHFVPQQGEVGVVNQKPRRRRKKNKSDGDAMMIRKRKLSEEQVKMLEQSFGKEHKLESERKDKLAAELGLDPQQVAVWFQNRRARWKSKNLEEEYSKLKSKHESTVLEKCHLQTELSKLSEQLVEAGKEIRRLSERWEGLSSNSPTSSLSMEAMQQEPPLLGDMGIMATDFDDLLFYAPLEKYVNGLEWDNLYNYM